MWSWHRAEGHLACAGEQLLLPQPEAKRSRKRKAPGDFDPAGTLPSTQQASQCAVKVEQAEQRSGPAEHASEPPKAAPLLKHAAERPAKKAKQQGAGAPGSAQRAGPVQQPAGFLAALQVHCRSPFE